MPVTTDTVNMAYFRWPCGEELHGAVFDVDKCVCFTAGRRERVPAADGDGYDFLLPEPTVNSRETC